MHIITVSPISDKMTPRFDRVSFYWRDHLEKGCIVPITFNNRAMRGIVVSSVHVREMKQLIKTSHFTMKKLEMSDTDIIPPSNLSNFIFTIADSTLQAPGKLLMHFFGENISLPPNPLSKGEGETAIHAYEHTHEKTIKELQQNLPDVIICPTSAFCQLLEQSSSLTLPQGNEIEHKTVFITPAQLPLFLLEHGHKYNEHTTLHVAVLYASDTRYIQHEKNPYMDYREIIIPALQNLYSGSVNLSLYDVYINPHVQNIFKLDDIDIARNTTTPSIYVSQHTKDTRYSDTMFSREAFSHILDTVSNDKTVQIITARKGISGSVSCSNCAFIAKCATCNHVQSIVQSNKTKIRNLYCHKCRTKSPVYDNCPQCDGMLAPLGYTTQTIYEALQNIPALENVPITIIDSDTTKTFKKLQQHISNFQKHTKNIIITTPAMTDYLPKPDLTVVVSFEGLLANPAYDQDSVMYRLLKSIEGSTIIQTKNENLDNIWTSNSESYSNYESELSHTYHTPPSGTFLTLSRLIPAQNIHTEVQYIQECIGNYNYIDYLHSTRGVKKGREIMIHHHLYYDIKNNERITQEILPLFTAYSMKKNIRIL